MDHMWRYRRAILESNIKDTKDNLPPLIQNSVVAKNATVPPKRRAGKCSIGISECILSDGVDMVINSD